MKAFLLFFAVFLTGCSTVKVSHGIPNFCEVEPGIWRGGEPNDEGWQYLRSIGVRYDLKLNTWSESTNDIGAIGHGIFVDDDGMIDLVHQTVLEPSGYWIDADLQSIVDQRSSGIFVHCEHGQDRTGLIIGLYRVRFEHWSKAKAYREMMDHGFHKSLWGLQRYWDRFARGQ